MTYTENYKLKLPEGEEVYNVEVFNDNTTAIDSLIETMNEKIATMQENFQDGVDSTYRAISSKGSTPSEKTLAAIAKAIEKAECVKFPPQAMLWNMSMNSNGFTQCNYTGLMYNSLSRRTGHYYPQGVITPTDVSGNILCPLANGYEDYKLSVRIQLDNADPLNVYDTFFSTSSITSVNGYPYLYSNPNDVFFFPYITIQAQSPSAYVITYNVRLFTRDFDDVTNQSFYRTATTQGTITVSNHATYIIEFKRDVNDYSVRVYNGDGTYLLNQKVVELEWNTLTNPISFIPKNLCVGFCNYTIDLRNTYIKVGTKIVWGHDAFDMDHTRLQ